MVGFKALLLFLQAQLVPKVHLAFWPLKTWYAACHNILQFSARVLAT